MLKVLHGLNLCAEVKFCFSEDIFHVCQPKQLRNIICHWADVFVLNSAVESL